MQKKINSEISLGFLVASLFWIGVVGWQSAYSPNEKAKDECYETAKKTGYKTDECKTFWERTTSDPIALFNLVLACSTVGLWVATISLYRAGEKQIDVARIAAEAANKSAETAQKDLFASHRPLFTIAPLQLCKSSPEIDTPHILFGVKNSGNGFGVVNRIGVTIQTVNTQGIQRVAFAQAPYNGVIESREESGPNRLNTHLIGIQEFVEIFNGRLALFVNIEIKGQDIFYNPINSKFAFVYNFRRNAFERAPVEWQERNEDS